MPFISFVKCKVEQNPFLLILITNFFLFCMQNGYATANQNELTKSEFKITQSDEIETTWAKSKNCSTTAVFAYNAAVNDMHKSYWISKGRCLSETNAEIRKNCQEEAYDNFLFDKQQIEDQWEARNDLCREIGEAPYNPIFKSGDFIDFKAVLEQPDLLKPNPYFPLVPGNKWIYHALDPENKITEKIVVEVLNSTKEIQGIECIVVQDTVTVVDDSGEDQLIELTYDWYAQDLEGNVWYFGEIVENYEDGELDNLDGSWKHGKSFAKAGIKIRSNPKPGNLYRQEFILGEAEDVAQVVSRGQLKIKTVLGEHQKDVLLTKEFTPIEPNTYELKYFVPGIGMVIEEKPDTGEKVKLVQALLFR
jgi:hypothetical protein